MLRCQGFFGTLGMGDSQGVKDPVTCKNVACRANPKVLVTDQVTPILADDVGSQHEHGVLPTSTGKLTLDRGQESAIPK